MRGPHSLSGRVGEEKNILPLPEFEPLTYPARHCTGVRFFNGIDS